METPDTDAATRCMSVQERESAPKESWKEEGICKVFKTNAGTLNEECDTIGRSGQRKNEHHYRLSQSIVGEPCRAFSVGLASNSCQSGRDTSGDGDACYDETAHGVKTSLSVAEIQKYSGGSMEKTISSMRL